MQTHTRAVGKLQRNDPSGMHDTEGTVCEFPERFAMISARC